MLDAATSVPPSRVEFEGDASPLFFRGLAFAAVGSVLPWGLLAYCLL